MPKQRTDHLVELVKTMSKAEKRSFRLFVNRESDAKSKLFYQLFEVLDKTNNYDENQILSKISRLKKSQLSNVKANLYQQLLNCLRQIKRKQVDEILIRELIDYAKILYDKGIYKAALEILDKAKRMAIDINYETLVMSIIYFEKRVESQHITRAFSNRAEDLSKLSNHIIDEMKLTNSLSNLSLLLYEKYLQFGYVKSEKEYEYIQSYFEETKPVVQLAKLNFYQSLYYFQSFVWSLFLEL